jgi:hypothetical protein
MNTMSVTRHGEHPIGDKTIPAREVPAGKWGVLEAGRPEQTQTFDATQPWLTG